MQRIFFNRTAFIIASFLIILTLFTQGCISSVKEKDRSGKNPAARNDKVLTGAIRWDAWMGDTNSIGRAVAKHLSQEKWHYRLPFFATIHDGDSVSINGLSQEIMDMEIEYASGALDYWAFLFYSGMMGTARELYLSSTIKDQLNFCLIIEGSRLINEWEEFHSVLSRSWDEPGYQTVMDNRPLLYLMRPVNVLNRKVANWQEMENKIQTIRDLAQRKGYADPYIVVMDYSMARIDSAMSNISADAVSCYAVGSGRPEEPFTELCGIVEKLWGNYTSTGYRIVPFLTAGWDPRPRWNIPAPWGYHDYGPNWTEPAIPEEIASHLAKAFQWIQDNPGKTPAKTVIIYSWNEHDEGGWLCPTMDPNGQADDSRLRALQKVRSKNHK